MERIISLANGSASGLYGCIGCAIKELILSKFPKDYFKYTTVSSELATRNIWRSFGGTNSRTEITKRQYPYLVIQPTYSVADRDDPFQNIPLTRNFDDLQYRVDRRYLFEVIRDKKYGYNLKFKLNRDRIEFDVTVVTDTLHHQLDIYRAIWNQIIWERSFSHRIALEAVIPKPLIAIMSKYCGMDLEQDEKYIPFFLKRLNQCSAYPITYKLRNASASDEWFMYYAHNIIITFSDLTIESGNKKNMSDLSYNITFRVTAEFNMPGVFFIDSSKDINQIDVSLKTKEYSEENDAYFPLYTIYNLNSKFPPELDGLQLYGSTIFQTTAGKNQLEDRVDIKCILTSDYMRVIRSHQAWNMNPDTLMKVYVLKDGEMLEYKKGFDIDWNTLELIVRDIDNTATYRLVIYFNYSTVNEILNNSAYNRNYDIDKLNKNEFPDSGIPDDIVMVRNRNDGYDKESTKIYNTGKVPEEKKGDPETVELFKSETYTPEINPVDDPDLIVYGNRAIVNGSDYNYKMVSDKMFLPGYVDPSVDDPVILEDDPTYNDDDLVEGIPFDTVDIPISNTSSNVKYSSSK